MNELITINEQNLVVFKDLKLNAVDLFEKKEVSKIVDTIKSELSNLVFDVDSESGRKDLQRQYRQIRKWSKSLDEVGKTHVAELKARPKIVDGARKSMRDELEAFADKLRQPLTDWEQAEEARKASILERIAAMKLDPDHELTDAEDFKRFLASVEAVEIDDSFDEYKGYAKETKEQSILMLEGMIARKEREEQEAREAEQRRKEAEEQARKEREEQIRKEAEERARKDAEAEARRQRAESERREREAKERAEQAERERIAAEERAKLEKEQAIQAERDRHARIEQERKAKEEAERQAAERKAANKNHRAKINNQILAGLSGFGISEDTGKKLIESIVKGEFPNVSINY